VRDEAAVGELHIAHKSNANWRLEACTLCPSLALQASILTKMRSLQNLRVGLVNKQELFRRATVKIIDN
jgi:hypothetical protein